MGNSVFHSKAWLDADENSSILWHSSGSEATLTTLIFQESVLPRACFANEIQNIEIQTWKLE